MKSLLLILLVLFLPSISHSEEKGKWFQIELEPPTEREDGSPVGLSEVVGYRIWWAQDRNISKNWQSTDLPKNCTRATLEAPATNNFILAQAAALYTNELGEIAESKKTKIVSYSPPQPFILQMIFDCRKNPEICTYSCSNNPELKYRTIRVIRNEPTCQKN